MKLILFSDPDFNKKEIPLFSDLKEDSLYAYHLRKPEFSEFDFSEYIKKLPVWIQSKTVIHSHYDLAFKFQINGIHLPEKMRIKFEMGKLPNAENQKIISTSFHKIEELDKPKSFEYIFLSPVFDSISKSGYKGAFQLKELKARLINNSNQIIALGGIQLSNIEKCNKLGFAGVALLGAIWRSPHPRKSLLEIFELMAKLNKG